MSDGSIVREQGSSSFTDGKAKKKVDLVRTYVRKDAGRNFFSFSLHIAQLGKGDKL